jgi:V/A-type H+-transporting ATPase subunit C
MPSDYGYINARIKGWHSRLLSAGALAEIIDLPDFPAFVKWVESGPYAADWQLARARYDGLDAVEWALESHFGAATGRLLKISEGGPHRLITVLLRRWDLANLKTVIRGIALKWSGHEIVRSLWPAGTLDLIKLKELAEQRTLRGVADILATWQDPLAAPLNACLAAFDDPVFGDHIGTDGRTPAKIAALILVRIGRAELPADQGVLRAAQEATPPASLATE